MTALDSGALFLTLVPVENDKHYFLLHWQGEAQVPKGFGRTKCDDTCDFHTDLSNC
jgi:hypothetical protein